MREAVAPLPVAAHRVAASSGRFRVLALQLVRLIVRKMLLFRSGARTTEICPGRCYPDQDDEGRNEGPALVVALNSSLPLTKNARSAVVEMVRRL